MDSKIGLISIDRLKTASTTNTKSSTLAPAKGAKAATKTPKKRNIKTHTVRSIGSAVRTLTTDLLVSTIRCTNNKFKLISPTLIIL